ncbi:hypothetical protein B0H14DRAFT_2615494 [Mycena olivaceomarginata]|nr:hypothetical protein B0H14DRAFT_2615494 [Mycena olivaceomarginata]
MTPMRGREADEPDGQQRDSSCSSSPSGDRGHCSPATGSKRARERTPDAENPFPDPQPHARPSEYLRSWCPLCLGNLEHDDSMLFSGCLFHTKDPPRTHPKTLFIPEAHAARTEEYVKHQKRKKPTKARATRVNDDDDDDDGYEHPELLLPRSVLDGWEASFTAADERRRKAMVPLT